MGRSERLLAPTRYERWLAGQSPLEMDRNLLGFGAGLAALRRQFQTNKDGLILWRQFCTVLGG